MDKELIEERVIYIAADHSGMELKNQIVIYLTNNNYKVVDYGTKSTESVDYPAYAAKVAQKVQNATESLGILCCGTGIGMSIVANKFKGIRAAVVTDAVTAKITKEHNDTNVLCLGQRTSGVKEVCYEIVDAWLNAKPLGGRHERRVAGISILER